MFSFGGLANVRVRPFPPQDLKDPLENRRLARASRSLYAGTAASQAREAQAALGFFQQKLGALRKNQKVFRFATVAIISRAF